MYENDERLDAVRAILRTIGESHIDTLHSGDVDVSDAEAVLDKAVRYLNSGWYHFNTQRKRIFTVPQDTGILDIPSNIIAVMKSDRLQPDLQVRKARVYNLSDYTYDLRPIAVGGKITLKALEALEYEDLPPTAKAYVLALARREFLQDVDADSLKLQALMRDEEAAFLKFKIADDKLVKVNYFAANRVKFRFLGKE